MADACGMHAVSTLNFAGCGAGNVSEVMPREAAVQPLAGDFEAYEHLGAIGLFLERNSLPQLLRDSLGGDTFLWTTGVLLFADTWLLSMCLPLKCACPTMAQLQLLTHVSRYGQL